MKKDELTLTADASSTPRVSRQAPPLPVLSIVAHNDAALLGRRHVVRDGVTSMLGRGQGLFGAGGLDDGRLSRQHVEIVRRGQEVQLRDLGSRNGTRVNGAALSQIILSSGDVIELGGVSLLFHWARRQRIESATPQLVAESDSMAAVLEQTHKAASVDVTVLIQGETGVGKEVVADEYHRASGRSGKLVAVNCAALADGVLQSELFGHIKGAFSGAASGREGLVASASGGTLFLDEVGDASPALQAALLRLLEQREYRQVGGDQLLSTDARFVAATHVSLEQAVAEGRFRQDLHSRLARWLITIPPLRERPADIIPLARKIASARLGQAAQLSQALTLALLRHHWPSNARELTAIIDQAVVESGGSAVVELCEGVEARLRPSGDALRGASQQPALPMAEALGGAVSRPSREQLVEHFRESGGNMRALSTQLGVSRATLYRWVKELGMSVDELRTRATRDAQS